MRLPRRALTNANLKWYSVFSLKWSYCGVHSPVIFAVSGVQFQEAGMYIPTPYRVSDQETIDRFIHENNFAALVSRGPEHMVATHLTLELEVGGDGTRYLTGHVARANRQWQSFSADEEVLAIFTGPHGYISPRWYSHMKDVPTWDYMAVHAYGKPHLITDPDELYVALKKQVDRYEAHSGAQAPYRIEDLPGDFLAGQMKAIVGLRIKVESMEASFKLSQGRGPQDYENVIAELEKSVEAGARAVAEAMRKVRPLR
jgi:transcriptional regulator